MPDLSQFAAIDRDGRVFSTKRRNRAYVLEKPFEDHRGRNPRTYEGTVRFIREHPDFASKNSNESLYLATVLYKEDRTIEPFHMVNKFWLMAHLLCAIKTGQPDTPLPRVGGAGAVPTGAAVRGASPVDAPPSPAPTYA